MNFKRPGRRRCRGSCREGSLFETLNTSSTAGYDGIDPQGQKIEVKCRRLTRYNNSHQLSAIRNLEKAHFDFLAGVLFNEDFSVMRAALIPSQVVKDTPPL